MSAASARPGRQTVDAILSWVLLSNQVDKENAKSSAITCTYT